jgi:tyrocidine synthetase-3
MFMDKRTPISVFEKRIEEFATAIALQENENHLTYSFVGKEIDRIAAYMSRAGVDRRSIVVLYSRPCSDYVMQLLAVLKLGAVFMPIDPSTPVARVKQMVQLANPILIFCREHEEAQLRSIVGIEFNVLIDDRVTIHPPVSNGTLRSGKDSSYLLFTSGSTGEPKAILGRNESLSHFIHWELGEFKLTRERVPLLAPIGFDVSLRDIFVPLLSGGTLVIPPESKFSDFPKFLKWFGRAQITLLHIVPSVFRLMMAELRDNFNVAESYTSVNYILLAGEPLYEADVRAWRQMMSERIELINLYGPTESTLAKVFHRIGSLGDGTNHIVPLGKAIGNAEVLIIDHQQLCVPLEKGEIYIRTPFLTNGYYKSEILNRERFIQNPLHNDFEDIVYKTGDLGYYNAQGLICYVGREDGLIKINGNRVEVLEVEHTMRKLPYINQVVVLVVESEAHDTGLAAFYTSTENIHADTLKKDLEAHLPVYMLPSYLIRLEHFPLSQNGKIDREGLRKLLKDKPVSDQTISYENELEEMIASIWKVVLRKTHIHPEASFFEVGGTSLKAIQVLSKVYKTLKVTAGLKELFAQPTIRSFAKICAALQAPKIELTAIEEQDFYPMSHVQQRMWILSEADPKDTAYYIDRIVEADADFDISSFESRLKDVVRNFEILRTYFPQIDDKPVQKVIEYHDFKLDHIVSVTTSDVSDPNAWLKIKYNELIRLDTYPLFKVNVLKLKAGTILFLRIHHSIADEWSLELMERHLLNGAPQPIHKPAIQYKDFSIWHDKQIGINSTFKKYWTDRLTPGFSTHGLIGDKAGNSATKRGDRFRIDFDKALSLELDSLLRNWKISKFNFWLLLINTVIYKYTGRKDNVIGAPVAGREHAELSDQLGCFVNTVALRVVIQEEEAFSAFASHTSNAIRQDIAHSAYPFDVVVNEIGRGTELSEQPIEIFLQFYEAFTDNVKYDAAHEFTGRLQDDLSLKFDLAFLPFEDDGSNACVVLYNRELYSQAFMQSLEQTFCILLQQIISSGGAIALGKLRVTSDHSDEPTTETKLDPRTTIHSLVSEKALSYPDRVAIVYKGHAITYSKLEKLSDTLAATLRREYNVGVNDIVAVLMPKSIDLMVTMLGIMKAGATYLPLDTVNPVQRISYILNDASPRLLIHDEEIKELPVVQRWAWKQGSTLAQFKDSVFRIDKESAIAYVLYTSGSTGQPKGASIKHSSVVNVLSCISNLMKLDEKDSVLGLASPAFDISIFEMIGSLINGARVELYNVFESGSMEELGDFISRTTPTIIQATPSIWNQLIPYFKPGHVLPQVISTGEALADYTAQQLIHTFGHCWNLYGPTETTIWSTWNKITKTSDLAVLGAPIQNTEVLIINPAGEVLPNHIVGELAISGAGLASGYLNNVELNLEKFIPHPNKSAVNMYRTGDLGMLTSAGVVLFGRSDDQVKINGYRIEPGEIDSVAREHTSVAGAHTVKILNAGVAALHIFVVVKDDVSPSVIMMWLGSRLPYYMLPSKVFIVDTIPFNSNGKVDRKALVRKAETLVELNDLPDKQLQLELTDIFQNILSKKSVGATDSFFDLGATSLHAIRLVNAIKDRYEVKISLRDVFTAPSINGLSRLIYRSTRKVNVESLLEEQEHYPLSAIQHGLWIHSRIIGTGAYNVTDTYKVSGDFDKRKFALSLRALIKLHPALRTTFRREGDTLRQYEVPEAEGCRIDEVNASSLKIEQLDEELRKWSNADIDICSYPLLRVKLYYLSHDQLIVQLSLPHLLTDAWSLDILYKDLIRLYEQEDLPRRNLNISYNQFVDLQVQSVQRNEQARDYWLERHKDKNGFAKVGRSIMLKQDEPAGREEFILTGSLFRAFQSLRGSSDASGFMVLMSWLKAYLYKFTGTHCVSVGTTVNTRNTVAVEDLLGCFVNTVAIRSDIDGTLSFASNLRNEQLLILEAFQHAHYPFEQLVHELKPGPDGLFEVLLEYSKETNVFEPESSKLNVVPYRFDRYATKFGMTIFAVENSDSLELYIDYAHGKISVGEVRLHIKYMMQLLSAIAAKPGKNLDAYSFLSSDDVKRIESYSTGDKVSLSCFDILHAIDASIENRGDDWALLTNTERITYRELGMRADRLAKEIRHVTDCQSQARIGILLGRSTSWVIAVLAAMKSNSVFVPVDPSLPESRIAFILNDCNASAIITTREYAGAMAAIYNGPMMVADDDLRAETFPQVSFKDQSEELAYILYTSGSTGNPKGVGVSRHNLANYILWAKRYYFSDSKINFGVITATTFDLTLTGMFVPLVSGGTIKLYGKHEVNVLLEDLFKDYEVGATKLTPSHIRMARQLGIKETHLQTIILGGEAITDNDLSYLLSLNSSIRVFNEYGPTETTVGVTVAEMLPGQMHIGKPIWNATAYVLDSHLNLTPEGQPGEIFIGGVPVSRGYINQPLMNEHSFISHPKYGRLYKTGDIGAWSMNGNLNYFGRHDRQVKVSGYRIECGEIEALLDTYPGITRNHVVAQQTNAGTRLISFYQSNQTVAPAELQKHLRSGLAEYAIPHAFVQVKQFELTANGKLDEEVLMKMITTVQETSGRDDTFESVFLEILGEVLQCTVSMDDDFFDLGGDSLRAIYAVTRIREKLALELPLNDIFDHPHMRDLVLMARTIRDNVQQTSKEFIVGN